MAVASHDQPVARFRQRGKILFILVLVIALAAGGWFWRNSRTEATKSKGPGAVPVVSSVVTTADISVKLNANGTVAALQSVDIRPQLSATIKTVHVREGQFVKQGERLFSLDVRSEDANLGKAEAQQVKGRADLANAERNLERQRELFRQKFISQTALDTVQNQVDGLRAQTAIDSAAVESTRVARSFGEIVAPIPGRTGTVSVYPGSLVQPSGGALVSITQVDPINVSFTLPERELASLQHTLSKGEVLVSAQLDQAGVPAIAGKLVFLDNTIDSASGTIRLKAAFPNADSRLWPGMFVTVSIAPRRLNGALTLPVQAVQTGPERKFVYLIGEEGKVSVVPVKVSLIQDGIAVIEGIAAGARVVLEGAQNLRPGSMVTEAKTAPTADKPGKP
jgi:RND family efflux transporter MFP subunit